jgi:membrane protein implicated in regulation of membrane protease activity
MMHLVWFLGTLMKSRADSITGAGISAAGGAAVVQGATVPGLPPDAPWWAHLVVPLVLGLVPLAVGEMRRRAQRKGGKSKKSRNTADDDGGDE